MATDWRGSISPELLKWAPPPRKVRYARVGKAGPFELPRTIVEEDWGEPVVRPEGVCFRRVTREVSASARVLEDACVRYGPDGLVDVGTWSSDGDLLMWAPAQCVLPIHPAVGNEWSATHRRADTESQRHVCIQACEQHKACLISVAEIRREDGSMVMRMHFGEGDGYAGYEVLIQREGEPSMRLWTEAFTVEVRSE